MIEKHNKKIQIGRFGKKFVIRMLVISVASFVMALNIKSFVRAGGLYPGGATGLTLLIQRYMDMAFDVKLPYTVINVIMNLFPIYIGFRFIGKKFTIYSCVMIMMTNIFTDILPSYYITSDMLLISIFGGLVNGAVISLCLRGNATTGGTDFIAIYLSEKKGMDSFPIVLGINAVIIGIAGFLFGWDKALYSIIFQYTSTQIVHLLYRQFQQNTFLVVTNNAEAVYKVINDTTHHGATIIDGEGSYAHKERKIVYSVVSSAQTKKLLTKVKKLDPTAFINVIKTEQVVGRFSYKKYE